MYFSIQICKKIFNNFMHPINKAKGYINKIGKTLIILCLGMFLQLYASSCKTCKCPAYSQIEIQNFTNMRNLTT